MKSHLVPRTRDGWIGTIAFLALFALTQPPLVFLIANRIEPLLLGVPFLYMYLLIIYIAMISVLIWVARRGV